MKPITLTIENWHKLLNELHKDYPPSVLAIKEKTKKVIGFTSRRHRIWVPNNNYAQEYAEYEKQIKDDSDRILLWYSEPSKGMSKDVIQLDFYDEAKRTFFLIKYSEFLK